MLSSVSIVFPSAGRESNVTDAYRIPLPPLPSFPGPSAEIETACKIRFFASANVIGGMD